MQITHIPFNISKLFGLRLIVTDTFFILICHWRMDVGSIA